MTEYELKQVDGKWQALYKGRVYTDALFTPSFEDMTTVMTDRAMLKLQTGAEICKDGKHLFIETELPIYDESGEEYTTIGCTLEFLNREPPTDQQRIEKLQRQVAKLKQQAKGSVFLAPKVSDEHQRYDVLPTAQVQCKQSWVDDRKFLPIFTCRDITIVNTNESLYTCTVDCIIIRCAGLYEISSANPTSVCYCINNQHILGVNTIEYRKLPKDAMVTLLTPKNAGPIAVSLMIERM